MLFHLAGNIVYVDVVSVVPKFQPATSFKSYNCGLRERYRVHLTLLEIILRNRCEILSWFLFHNLSTEYIVFPLPTILFCLVLFTNYLKLQVVCNCLKVVA